MANNKAAEILFAEASRRLAVILGDLEGFNEIMEGLAALGYGREPHEPVRMDSDDCPAELPFLELIANGHVMVDDDSLLDECLEEGPRLPKKTKSFRSPSDSHRKRLGAQTGWACTYCRQTGGEELGPDGRKWHVDHSYPVVKGGDDREDNLVLACATCNLKKHSMSALEFFGTLPAPVTRNSFQ